MHANRLGTAGAQRTYVLIHLPTNQLTRKIIGCAMEVHSETGPGLLERTYVPCLAYELQKAELSFVTKHPLALNYKGVRIPFAYKLDFVVQGEVAVEIKAVENLLPVHTAQLMTYLRLGNYPVGLVLNFNSVMLRDGIVRVINSRYDPTKSEA
jgi:GxxExxY protein